MKKSLFFILILCVSCVKEVPLPIREVKGKIVVEGTITDAKPPYVFKLSTLGRFNYFSNPEIFARALSINDAVLTITDDRGIVYTLGFSGPGEYRTPSNFRGEIDRSYSLKIRLSNGDEYLSRPEKMVASPAITKISAKYHDLFLNDVMPDGYNVFVTTNDPANEENFYRWTASGFSRRKTQGDFDFFCNCFVNIFCWDQLSPPGSSIASDLGVNGRLIEDKFVFFSPAYFTGQHYLEVQQFSLTRDAYQFWKKFEEQRTRVGSIFDALPAPIEGNIVNTKDKGDLALGYFGVSSIKAKRIIIPADTLNEAHLLRGGALRERFIPKNGCPTNFPTASPLPPVPWL